MPNQYKNKVVYGNTTLIDLTNDTVTAASMLQGKTAHGATGAVLTGTLFSNGSIWVTTNSNANPSIVLGIGTWRKILSVDERWDDVEYTWDQADVAWDNLPTYYIWLRIS